MNNVQRMLDTHPREPQLDRAALVECIQACYDCAQVCTTCADACLAEDMVQQLRHCIRLNLDCADVCDVTGRVLSRQTEPSLRLLQLQLQACRQACRACGAVCQEHADHHEHCRVCAESCRRCEQACDRLLSAMGAAQA